MEKRRLKLPIGFQAFEELRTEGFFLVNMKKIFYLLVIGIFALAGCDKGEDIFTNETGCDKNKDELTKEPGLEIIAPTSDGFWLKMGDNTVVPPSDIDFYDVSTHIIYLKKTLPYLKNIGFGSGLMTVNVGKDEIYKCSFHSSLSSSLPQGAYVRTPPFNKEDIIRISFMQFLNEDFEPKFTDPRNDERIIEALKKYGQYHEGLHCEIRSCNYSDGKLVFNIVLSNTDTFDYYHLDISKMGLGLFHYFTNGPTFWNFRQMQSYTHQETVIHPTPWNDWKKEWLSLIKSGESKNISITYNHFERMPEGQYRIYFQFPGLNYGISQKDLVLKDGRIWMGSIDIEEDYEIKY